MLRNTFFSALRALGEGSEALSQAAARAVEQVLRAGPGWLWLVLFAAGSPWLRVEWRGWALYPGHWALAVLLAIAFLRSGSGRGGDPLPLKGALVLCAWLAGLALLRGEGRSAAWLLAATAANFAWGWGAYRLGRHSERAGAAVEGLVLFVTAALAVELAAWALAAFWPPACLLVNCPAWPEDPPRFRGGFDSPAQFGLLVALALPVLAPPWLTVRQTPQARPQRLVLIGIATAIGLALLAGGGAWLVPAAGLLWLGLFRALAPWGDPRDAAFLKRLALWMVVVPVLFYAFFPGYLGLWFTLERPSWGHVRIVPSGPTPRVLSSERTAAFLLAVTNEGAFPLPGGATIVPRLLISPARGRLRAHDLEPAALPRALGGHETAQVAVPVRLPPWVQEGFLSWQVKSADGRTATLSEDSAVGLRFLNADYRSLADTRENLLSALAERARRFSNETFVPETEGPAPASVEKVFGDVLDSLIFSPLWGEAKTTTRPGHPFPPNRPFLAHLVAEYGLIALLLALRLGWIAFRQADLLGLRTTKPAARLGWPLVPASLAIAAVLGLFSPAPGSFHGQWGLFLLIGYIEGRYDRLVPPHPAAPRRLAPLREGVRALARGLARLLERLPRPPWWLRRLMRLRRLRWPRPPQWIRRLMGLRRLGWPRLPRLRRPGRPGSFWARWRVPRWRR